MQCCIREAGSKSTVPLCLIDKMPMVKFQFHDARFQRRDEQCRSRSANITHDVTYLDATGCPRRVREQGVGNEHGVSVGNGYDSMELVGVNRKLLSRERITDKDSWMVRCFACHFGEVAMVAIAPSMSVRGYKHHWRWCFAA